MNAATTSISCGILEIYNLYNLNAVGLVPSVPCASSLECMMRIYEHYCSSGQKPVIIFSDNITYKYGEKLANDLRKHPRLGSIVETGYVRNHNSGNDINIWMFIRSVEYRDALLSDTRSRNGSVVDENGNSIIRDIYKQFLSPLK